MVLGPFTVSPPVYGIFMEKFSIKIILVFIPKA
jgi:hypothetical protein